MGRGLTFGASLSDGTDSQLGAAFLRYTFTNPAAPTQFAAEFGAALRQSAGLSADQPLARLGLSLGRGFGAPGRTDRLPFALEGGWTSLQALAYLDPTDNALEIWQAEATLGISFANGRQAALALKAEECPAVIC